MVGICILSSIALRAEPSHKGEMISQLLFGDMYAILDMHDNWLEIKCLDEGYYGSVGYINKLESFFIEGDEFDRLLGKPNVYFTANNISKIFCVQTSGSLLLSLGSKLYGKKKFRIGNLSFIYSDRVYVYDKSQLGFYILKKAESCLNIPYLWGGKTVMGFDCSGFVQIIYRMNGIFLPRDASQQSAFGTPANIENAKEGTLAFFGQDNNITHVGIIAENNKVIHCSGKVRIDPVDKTGIYNEDLKEYTHKLLFCKDVFMNSMSACEQNI